MKKSKKSIQIQSDFKKALKADRAARKKRNAPAPKPKVSKSKLTISEKYNYVKKFIEPKFKSASRLGRKNKARISTAYRQLKQLEQNEMIFVPLRSEKRRAMVKKIYGQTVSKDFKGAFVPYRAAGPQPKLKFGKESFSIYSKEMPAQTIFPLDPVKYATKGDKYIDDLLAGAPELATYAPVTDSQGALTKYGFTQDKKHIKQLISDWINTYGFTQGGSKSNNHDMGNWFVGIKLLHQDGDDEGEDE